MTSRQPVRHTCAALHVMWGCWGRPFFFASAVSLVAFASAAHARCGTLVPQPLSLAFVSLFGAGCAPQANSTSRIVVIQVLSWHALYGCACVLGVVVAGVCRRGVLARVPQEVHGQCTGAGAGPLHDPRGVEAGGGPHQPPVRHHRLRWDRGGAVPRGTQRPRALDFETRVRAAESQQQASALCCVPRRALCLESADSSCTRMGSRFLFELLQRTPYVFLWKCCVVGDAVAAGARQLFLVPA
jgi:hypothetical protein